MYLSLKVDRSECSDIVCEMELTQTGSDSWIFLKWDNVVQNMRVPWVTLIDPPPNVNTMQLGFVHALRFYSKMMFLASALQCCRLQYCEVRGKEWQGTQYKWTVACVQEAGIFSNREVVLSFLIDVGGSDFTANIMQRKAVVHTSVSWQDHVSFLTSTLGR